MRNRSNNGKTRRTKAPDQMPWRVTGNHVYPFNDLREHSLTNCWGRPTDEHGILVHNSLDGRERYERGDRKLS